MMKLLALMMSLVAIAPLLANSQNAKESMDENGGKSKSSEEDETTMASPGPPACSSLQPVEIEYENMMKLSPFVSMRGKMNTFNCSQTVYVGPAANGNGYTGTGIVLQQGITFSFQHQLIDKNTFRTTLCTTGEKADYPIVHAKLSSHSSSLCVVNCAHDGIAYNDVYCIGRTAEDGEDIDKFLNSTLSGVPGIVDLQLGCLQPQYCDLFNH